MTGDEHSDLYSVSPAAMSDEQIARRDARAKGNEPAFPCSSPIQYWGISIREQAAIAALQGLLANPNYCSTRIHDAASVAVESADALMEWLSK